MSGVPPTTFSLYLPPFHTSGCVCGLQPITRHDNNLLLSLLQGSSQLCCGPIARTLFFLSIFITFLPLLWQNPNSPVSPCAMLSFSSHQSQKAFCVPPSTHCTFISNQRTTEPLWIAPSSYFAWSTYFLFAWEGNHWGYWQFKTSRADGQSWGGGHCYAVRHQELPLSKSLMCRHS